MEIKNVVCPFCGCLCDDITVKVEDNEIKAVKNGCGICITKFIKHHVNAVQSPMLKKEKTDENFVNVSMDEAIEKTGEILKNAKYPLIFGLSTTECEAQGKALELAELTGATIDQLPSVCHGPSIMALQSVGQITATLGEVKNRADMVIFWGCNPIEAHPRHFNRYSGTAAGMWSDRNKRYIVTIDVRETHTAKKSDKFIKISPGKDYELISIIRAAIKGQKIPDNVEEMMGVNKDDIENLINKMKGAKYGVVFYGMGMTQSFGKELNTDGAISLVKELNEWTKFSINPMLGHYNVAGAVHVWGWQSGYPFSINFSLQYPRYNPGEFSATQILARKECDAALIIATDPVAHLPNEAARHLAEIPVITIDPKFSLTALISDVVIPCATAGIEAEGTAYRMDGIPLRLKRVVRSEFLSDREILERLIEKIKEK
ncbi:MAG: formylmethanofuran dehydrogenase subunit B [Candidatus Altarchaeum sp. CG12_big_fil_rev_8_21_14_0_65_33_22]|nr:MAG: formylmethanofuran dehydrogenase subunit B [Candidatus Altarchaeum sp. CG12_big_fil_rev_8_21_14_0_65_33_22]